ncbi:MAG TPA: DsbA family oxidoreductase [Candidatus Bathyarchaeia archaeon]|nr:DsbA family oxidoreductase [Candidatus Bathyarchaeia archaeon]
MIIEVFQDTVCPWCRIGKKNLMDAVQAWSGESITIRYRSYFLDPNVPKEGLPYREAMAAIRGDASLVEPMLNQVTEAGRKVGVTFRFDRVEKRPNTYASHVLLKLAPEERSEEMVEAVYRAHFEEGLDIGDVAVLASIAQDFGITATQLQQAIDQDTYKQEIAEDLAYARDLQITGVPFFVIDQKLALSGAHPVENFLRAFQQAVEEA